jgi:NADP-dependent alcohol dehydrogenase
MDNFTFHNPTKIIFGRGSITELGTCIPRERRVLLTYGGGSIKANGVYDQVMAALPHHTVLEFSGIEMNCVADMARSIVRHSGLLGERHDIGERDIIAILQSRA